MLLKNWGEDPPRRNPAMTVVDRPPWTQGRGSHVPARGGQTTPDAGAGQPRASLRILGLGVWTGPGGEAVSLPPCTKPLHTAPAPGRGLPEHKEPVWRGRKGPGAHLLQEEFQKVSGWAVRTGRGGGARRTWWGGGEGVRVTPGHLCPRSPELRLPPPPEQPRD